MTPHENGQRRIEFSDIAPVYAEIQQHPYTFLGLPNGANIADVRARYIAQARLYHEDMVNPSFDQQALAARYTPEDFATLENIPHTPDENPEQLFEHLKEALLTIQGVSEEELKRKLYALNIIQAAAHEKMIQLNTAFETIKMQIGERQWKVLAGYDSRIVHDEDGFDFQQIFLEGAGELTVLSKTDEYCIPGAYLAFDWGPFIDHESSGDDDSDYRHDIAVKHLFVHQELQEGRKQITPYSSGHFLKLLVYNPSNKMYLCNFL